MVRKALVVEDEVDTSQILAEHLRRWGFEPTVLNEGKPAVPWVRENHPDHGASSEGAGSRILELTEARRILLP
jgi:DNA-binding NtrC family response regulator